MKKNFFIALIATAALTMTGCSNDDVNEVDYLKHSDKAYISIGLSTTPASDTRGLAGPELTPGTADECKVNTVTAIFFDGNAGTSTVTDVVELNTAQVGTVGTQSIGAVAGQAFQVSANAKYLMVVVNKSSSFTGVATGQTLSAVNQAVSKTTEDLIGTGKDNFEMTNASGELLSIISNLKNTSTAAESAPAEISVDRAVAKVNLTVDSNYKANSNTLANVNYVGWLLNVTNKKYYPMSARVQTAKNTPTTLYGAKGSYRVDPNYTVAQNSLGEYNIQTALTASTWYGKDDYLYCLENTQEQLANMAGFTTQVLIKAMYCPKQVTDINPVDGTTTPLTLNVAGENWIMIGSAQYTWATLKNWVENELRLRTLDAAPGAFATPIYNSLKDFLAANSVNLSGLTSTADGPTAISEAATAKTEIDAISSTTVNGWLGQEVGNFKYYKDAFSYYQVPIKHDNDDSDTFVNQLGEFGVVRNSFYRLTVNKFLNPGDPSIKNPDPSTPDEDLQKYISVKIVVNPWTTWTQSIDL